MKKHEAKKVSCFFRVKKHKKVTASLQKQPLLWYNQVTTTMNTITEYFTPYQLKLPLEFSVLIDVDDPIYSFSEVMNHVDLKSFFAEKDCRMGRPGCDSVKLLKIILFAFMEGGYEALRSLAKLCRTDIRYMRQVRIGAL